MAKLDKLIADFDPLNTKEAEAVAKLCRVWNDLFSDDASGEESGAIPAVVG